MKYHVLLYQSFPDMTISFFQHKIILAVVDDQRMKTIMSLEQLTTLEAINQFLEGTQSVAFNVVTDNRERYRWVQKTLVKHRYLLLGKMDRGIVTRYLMKVAGYSLAQTKRLIRQNRHNLSEAGPP